MAKKTISVDQTFEQVLQSDQKGDLLVFEYEPGKFLELSDAQVAELSLFNKGSYMVSRDQFKKALIEQELPSFLGTATITQAADPIARLTTKGGNPDMHRVWKRPDEYAGCVRDGYRAVQGDSVETFASRVGSTHTVGDRGQEELILMEIPKERFMAKIKAVEALSQRRTSGKEVSVQASGAMLKETSDDDSTGWRQVREEGDE